MMIISIMFSLFTRNLHSMPISHTTKGRRPGQSRGTGKKKLVSESDNGDTADEYEIDSHTECTEMDGIPLHYSVPHRGRELFSFRLSDSSVYRKISILKVASSACRCLPKGRIRRCHGAGGPAHSFHSLGQHFEENIINFNGIKKVLLSEIAYAFASEQ
jgi:hypothetical protein